MLSMTHNKYIQSSKKSFNGLKHDDLKRQKSAKYSTLIESFQILFMYLQVATKKIFKSIFCIFKGVSRKSSNCESL